MVVYLSLVVCCSILCYTVIFPTNIFCFFHQSLGTSLNGRIFAIKILLIIYK